MQIPASLTGQPYFVLVGEHPPERYVMPVRVFMGMVHGTRLKYVTAGTLILFAPPVCGDSCSSAHSTSSNEVRHEYPQSQVIPAPDSVWSQTAEQ